MSELMTDEEQIIWFLREFENAEDDQLEFCELEIYGEDEQGREGTCTISVQEIAKMAADFITKLQSERDALAATVEAFTTVISERFTGKEPQPDGTIITDGASWALELLKTTPQQHLRDVRAEAGRAGFVEGAQSMKLAFQYSGTYSTQSKADQYAEKVRSGKA